MSDESDKPRTGPRLTAAYAEMLRREHEERARLKKALIRILERDYEAHALGRVQVGPLLTDIGTELGLPPTSPKLSKAVWAVARKLYGSEERSHWNKLMMTGLRRRS